jgi:ABC-type branched-subunit amino acid transport system substrate-binding protein/Tfp pilus assembly protein PilF
MFSFRFSAGAAVLSLVLALSGCLSQGGQRFAKLPTITSSDPRAEAELREAQALDDKGDVDAAATRYRSFVTQRPKDPLVPVAELGLGRILLNKGTAAEAKTLFDRVARHPDVALAERGRFYGAVARHRLGEDASAVQTLQPMIGRPVDPADTSLLLKTLAEALEGLTRYGEAITTLDKLTAESTADADRRWAEAKIAELAKNKASAQEISRLYDDLPRTGVAWRYVVRRAVRDADAAQDKQRTHDLLGTMREQDLPIDEELAAIAVRAERSSEANPLVVGAVLSLSGRGRKVGELASRGLMLAAGLPLQGPPSADTPQLVFRDDGGDPERAAQAVSDLVSVHRAVAIIGPMDVRAADAASVRAQELGVPIVLLSPGGRATDRGKMVYRYFATADDEIHTLLQQAKAIGRSRVAALLPQGPYGDLMDATLRAQAKAVGMDLSTIERYAAGATAFGEQTATLAKQSFDALLLADDARQVSMIAPALAAAGLWCTPAGEQPQSGTRAISVIAPAVAFDHGLAHSVGRYLQGALFSVPFDAQSSSGPGQRFVERFQSQFGEPPDTFAALAHDAYKLVRKAVDAGATTRKALAESLPRAESNELAGPSPGLSKDRIPRRPTRLLELRGDSFVPIAP